MKISVDAGALCAVKNSRYGTYTFTKNLIEAIHKFDKKNEYYLYSFCDKPNDLLLTKKIRYKHILPQKFWMKFRVSLEEMVEEKKVFLALNQALPFITNTKIIGFSHGLSFYYFRKYYASSFSLLVSQLDGLVKRAGYIVVSSSKVKKEFKNIYPNLENIKILPFGIPFDFLDKEVNHSQKLAHGKYFLFVGMDHPVKNIGFLVEAFKEFTKDVRFKNYKLCLVTNSKHYEKISDNIYVFTEVKRLALKNLYQHAKAFLIASHYESFNLPVLEALSQDCQVIGTRSSIIPEFKPYVRAANNKKEFVAFMKNTALGEKIKINHKKLKKEFSWEKYIEELVKLF